MLPVDERNRPWWTLVGACFGLFILMLDSTVVALALSSIREDVGADAEQLQWVMNGYLLTIAVLVVTAGRIGDMFGRKRVFLAGLILFGAGSVLSGASQDPQMLIGGRILQGTGAAPMLTLSLAIVCNAFSSEKQAQARAVGIWAGVSAIALAFGPLVGGALIALDWRAIFWINLPIVALGLAITSAAAPESRDPGTGTRIDLPGLIALTVGLSAVVLASIQSSGWGAAATASLGAIGVLVLTGFWLIEHRVRDPIVEFELFRNGPYFGASAAGFAIAGAYWAVMFFQPQYLQDALGHSAIESGLLILPVTVPTVAISPFAGRLIGRFGSRGLMTAGMLCAIAGLAVLTQIDPTSAFGVVLAGYLLFGIALGIVYAPMSAAAMAAMPAEKVGIASGVLAMDKIVAGALALAATGAVFHALRASDEGFTAALAGSTWVLVGMAVIGTALTWTFVRDSEAPGPDRAVAGEPPPEQLQHPPAPPSLPPLSRPRSASLTSATESRSDRRREQVPATRHALERGLPTIRELEAGASNQIPDGAGDEHLAVGGLCGDARRDVDRDAADVVSHLLDLTGVHACPDLQPDAPQILDRRVGETYRPARPVEHGEEPVAGRVQLGAAELREAPPDQRLMALEQVLPVLVTERRCTLGRSDDVGEPRRYGPTGSRARACPSPGGHTSSGRGSAPDRSRRTTWICASPRERPTAEPAPIRPRP